MVTPALFKIKKLIEQMGRFASADTGLSTSLMGQNSHPDAEGDMSLQTTTTLGQWVLGSRPPGAPFSFSAEGVVGRKGALCAQCCSVPGAFWCTGAEVELVGLVWSLAWPSCPAHARGYSAAVGSCPFCQAMVKTCVEKGEQGARVAMDLVATGLPIPSMDRGWKKGRS